ncbi:DEAD/DEAH box helicase family protein [Candidatus Woesearchaeota archaeon]|jgi:type III restriction enzyme|nr:DEAD/DEAH box helicase family protein [Candidatus Woesearchaeota archaeon]
MVENKVLYETYNILSEEGILEEKYPEMPQEIRENINPKFNLRKYQKEAFRRFFYYYEKDEKWPKHILFNMATGSGKTLIMAGLILNLYKKGYRNFVFFVNSKNIIEKTKKNFLDDLNEKYLFGQNIEVDNEKVKIKETNDLVATSSKNINIFFTTIQKFHGDLCTLKENSLTFEDFENNKTVFIADEAHHLNVSTKTQEDEEKENWEGTVIKALNKNSRNLLLEFTATVEIDNQYVRNKYKDKILYRYDLEEFRKNGYSKEIKLLESDFNKKERILQAIILNEYRRQVAIKSKIKDLTNFKPVILFKSKNTIEESKNNFFEFREIINNLNNEDIKKIKENRSNNELIKTIFSFFKRENISDNQLISLLKKSFSKEKSLLTNEEDLDKKTIKEKDVVEILNQQDVLNSLENEGNNIRVIFTVNKLTEGWDVLNLFDIVRLYTGQTMGGTNKRKPGKTTIQEAQLIGRGARYCPFNFKEMQKDKRKFDSDLDNDLRILEEVHYHCHPGEKSRYISEITQTLKSQGWLDEGDTVKKKLKLKDKFKQESLYKYGNIYANDKYEVDFSKICNIDELGVSKKNITFSLVTGRVKEETAFEEKKENGIVKTEIKTFYIQEINKYSPHLIKKALSKNKFFTFESLSEFLPSLNSMNDFIQNKNLFSNLRIDFNGTKQNLENISNQDFLDAIISLLNQLEEEIKQNSSIYKGSHKFYPKYKIKETIREKTLEIKKGSSREQGQEEFLKDKDWYVFESNFGTPEEKSLVEFMDTKIRQLSKTHKNIFLIRNEREVKLYDFKKGRVFEPDFILFLTENNTKKEVGYQIFVEPKGEGFKEKDAWKEEFLLDMRKKFKIEGLDSYYENKDFKIIGLPFYNQNDPNVFGDRMEEDLKIQK